MGDLYSIVDIEKESSAKSKTTSGLLLYHKNFQLLPVDYKFWWWNDITLITTYQNIKIEKVQWNLNLQTP